MQHHTESIIFLKINISHVRQCNCSLCTFNLRLVRTEWNSWILGFTYKQTNKQTNKQKNTKHRKALTTLFWVYPVDTGRKLNVYKMFRRHPGRLMNVLRTFNLRPVSAGYAETMKKLWWNTRKLSSIINYSEAATGGVL